MIPWFKVRLFHGTIWICRWRMNMLAMSQYQPRLSRIMTVAPGRSANQIVVLTSNKIFIYICNILFTIQIRPLKNYRRVRWIKYTPRTRIHYIKWKYIFVSLYIKYSQSCPCGHLYWAVTYIKRSPFFCPVIVNFIRIEPLLRGHLS